MFSKEDFIRANGILLPHSTKRQQEFKNQGIRFVHYTTAEAAMSILKTKQIWMRNPSFMNDLTDVVYGRQRLIDAYNNSEKGKELRIVLNEIFENVSKDVEQDFNEVGQYVELDTYLTCLSEHEGKDADKWGRLSMWRAYDSKTTGIALVINATPVFEGPDDSLLAVSPVAYLDQESFELNFSELTKSIASEKDFLKTFGREVFIKMLSRTFLYAAASTKHPSFAEEKEWRLIYLPKLFEDLPEPKSSNLTDDIVTVNGNPQKIFKIALNNLPQLLNKVIIGPSQHPMATYEAFIELLKGAGIPEPWKILECSFVPLRK
jgi:hypothetical protein